MNEIEIAIKGAELLVKLGAAVYAAIQKGDRSRTVGEIFDGVRKDLDEIERLREEARARLAPVRGSEG